MYVALDPGLDPSQAEDKVTRAIDQQIGRIARPQRVRIVPDMPEPRSGKIMHRVIAAVSDFAAVGDVTTSANPEIVEDTRHRMQSAKVASGRAPHDLGAQEAAAIRAFGDTG